MQITSSDFQHQEPIPARFSRDGENINPSLTFSEIPENTKSLALTVEDPDAPGGVFTHWILYNMSPATLQIVAGELPVSGKQGTNDYKEIGYGGPKPPAGQTHRYYFHLFALDNELSFEEGVIDRVSFHDATSGHIIDDVELIGTYTG